MKKQFLFLLIALPFLLIGCEKETLLTVDQTSINIPDTGGSQAVSLTANKPWTASSDQSWCKVSPSSGEEATSSRVTVSCDPNTTYDARNATVTFICAELTKQVSVAQATNNGLMVTQTSFELTKAAQQISIEVNANLKFSVVVDSGCKDWVKYNTTKGLTTSIVVLDIAENKTYDSREGTVTIKQDGGSLSSTISIKQSQLDGLFLTTSEYNLSNERHTLTVDVSTNVEFDVKPEADWVKYIQTKGLNTKQIVLEISENDTYDQRETKVNVKQKNGDLSGSITIKQDEKYGIFVSQSEYNLTNEAQTIDVEVKFNVDFEVVIPEGCKDWIKQVSTKGLKAKNYTFSITNNKTYDNREGGITFKQKSGSLSGTVAIKQAQTDYLEVSKHDFTVDIEGEIINIDVTSNVDYTVTISEDAQSWLSRVETKGLSKDNLQIAVAAGDDYTDRTGEILVRYGDLKQTILVHQYSYASNTIIKFADEKIKAKLVDAFDMNNDGELSIKEARAVKSIEGVFGAIKTYTSFDEFQYFTGVTSIPEKMFNAWRLTSIVLPESIEKVGWQAFADCSVLVNIKMPSNIKDIGSGAFMGCSSLPEIVFPDGPTRLREEIFADCSSLTAITLPNSILTFESACFRNCTSIKTVSLPSDLTSIGDNAFNGCSSLASIIIPKTVQTIEGGAFYSCSSLESVTIPQGVTLIADKTFCECTKLKIVDIPDTITRIGDSAFGGCTNLLAVVIPDGTTAIGGYAFSNCQSLTEINIPESVTFIGGGAFRCCSGLNKVNIPESITTISPLSFDHCSNLTEIYIPESVTSIGGGAFAYCSGLKTINIPESVTSIEAESFYKCIALSSIDLPNSITNIGGYAFYGCTNLSSITIPDKVTVLYFGTFYGCENLKTVLFPKKFDSIGWDFDYTFELYRSVVTIGCFESCINLSEIHIPEDVKYLGPYTFSGCSKLVSINLPKQLTTINRCLFSYCSKLSSIILPESLIEIRYGAFEFCSSLTSITIPKSVQSIGSVAFAECTGLISAFFLPITPPKSEKIIEVFHQSKNNYLTNTTFYVPAESVDTYKNDENWNMIANRIQAIPE